MAGVRMSCSAANAGFLRGAATAQTTQMRFVAKHIPYMRFVAQETFSV